MLSSINATHLNSAGNRTKTVTFSLLLKMMRLNAPETKIINNLSAFRTPPMGSESRHTTDLVQNLTHQICSKLILQLIATFRPLSISSLR